jgi:hypothetical protein
MRRVKAGVATAVAIAFTAGAAQAQAEQTYRFEPVDAAICKKRTAMGDKSGGKTKLAPNKKHKYNAGDGNDTLIGGKKDDILNGGRGNDKVFGGGGNDVVCGGVGNDKVFGDEGNDRVFGEEDNDFLDGGEGNDRLNGQAGSIGWSATSRRRARSPTVAATCSTGASRPTCWSPVASTR